MPARPMRTQQVLPPMFPDKLRHEDSDRMVGVRQFELPCQFENGHEFQGPEEAYSTELRRRWNRNVVEAATRAGLNAPDLKVLEAQYRAIQHQVDAEQARRKVSTPERSPD